jgi:hypothetical protein
MTPWRFCNKCQLMFFDGNPQKGRCAAGDGHTAQGLTFNLPHDVPETDHDQAHWRFCNKCSCMFFHGSQENGTCPAGGGHETKSKNNYVLHHDVPENFPMTQGAWRFCSRCSGLFFDGFPEKGTCPAGGPHQAAGFIFVLPTTTVKFDDNN